MTKKDTAYLLSILRAAYPRFYYDVSPEDLKISVETWAVMLSDASLEVARE